MSDYARLISETNLLQPLLEQRQTLNSNYLWSVSLVLSSTYGVRKLVIDVVNKVSNRNLFKFTWIRQFRFNWSHCEMIINHLKLIAYISLYPFTYLIPISNDCQNSTHTQTSFEQLKPIQSEMFCQKLPRFKAKVQCAFFFKWASSDHISQLQAKELGAASSSRAVRDLWLMPSKL